MQQGQYLVSALQLSTISREHFKKLIEKKITAIAWDYYKDEEGIFPLVRAMGEIAGTTAILIAAELLGNYKSGRKTMLGGISGVTPTEVVIIGSGTVGEYAARAAIGLGASVMVFDESTYKMRRLQNDIGIRLKTCTLQPAVLERALKTADVAIGAVRAKEERTPCIVNENMVSGMKEGSVIIDISIDQGGCFETTHPTTHENPTYMVENRLHYAVANMPGAVPHTSTPALTNATLPYALKLADHGWKKACKDNLHLANGLNIVGGAVVNQAVADAFDLPFTPITPALN